MTQLTGGAFQDPLGNPLANGYLLLQLNQDAQYATSNQLVFGGVAIRIQLDANGNVASTQSVWANGDLTPAGTFYYINVYNSKGVLQNNPTPLTITIPSGSTYNLGLWIP